MGNGVIDLVDYTAFEGYSSEPGQPVVDINCSTFDFDVDGDIDLSDLATFAVVF